ncbi:MAG: type II secretion system protein [Fibrobacter sp.]|nr:type II secretion system protein [Fibrobacter sp.]
MDKKNGFTLIEIMVVIVIMGILAAVGVPKLFGMIAKAKAAELHSAAGSYIHLQEAYLHQEHGIGSWKDIGYEAPGNGTTKYFTYGNCQQDESSEEGGTSFIGWHATNLSSLNECSANNSWGLVIAPVSNGIAYYSRVVSSAECAANTNNWNVGEIDVGGCTAGAAQTAQATPEPSPQAAQADQGQEEDGAVATDGNDASTTIGCENAKGNGLDKGNKSGFLDTGECIIQKGQAKDKNKNKKS